MRLAPVNHRELPLSKQQSAWSTFNTLPVHLETNPKQLPMSANIISEKSRREGQGETFKSEELETGQEIYSIFSKKKPSIEKLRRGLTE